MSLSKKMSALAGSDALYQKCMACRGTKRTVYTFNEGRADELAAGAPCFACCDDNGKGEPTGFVEVGVSYGQWEAVVARHDTALVLLADIPLSTITDKAIRSRIARFLTGKDASVYQARCRVETRKPTDDATK